MSSNLTLLTRGGDGPSPHVVYWACGRLTQGQIRVTVHTTVDDGDVVAELGALQHLLEDLEVCGRDRAGNALQITVSRGAIKKLAAGQSAKQHLVPFASFLRTRFSESRISVDKDPGFILPQRSDANVLDLAVRSPRPTTVCMPDGVRVGVTEHVLLRFQQRFQVATLSAAWRFLRAEASHPATRLLGHVHGPDRARSVSYLSASGVEFVVVHQDGGPVMVTVYWRKPALRPHAELKSA